MQNPTRLPSGVLVALSGLRTTVSLAAVTWGPSAAPWVIDAVSYATDINLKSAAETQDNPYRNSVVDVRCGVQRRAVTPH